MVAVAGLVALRSSEALRLAVTLVELGMATFDGSRSAWATCSRRLLTAIEGVTTQRTARLTLIRADCVRLSSTLVRNGRANDTTERWAAAAARDELPEVRFADR